MNIDAVNLTLTQIKSLGINAFDTLNNVSTKVPLSSLAFSKGSDENVTLLHDPISKMGIIMKKIALSSIFPSKVDIRPFKKGLATFAQDLTESDIGILNNKYSTPIVIADPNILNTASSFDVVCIKDFVTFCRTFGFYELTLNDVHLSKSNGKLIISVNSTHNYFTGFIEVLV